MVKVKKGIIIFLSILLTSCLMMPSFIYAEEIQGFDYDNYYQLEYIASDGSAYIDTGFSSASRYTKYTGQFDTGGYNTGYIYGAGMGTNSSSYYQCLWIYQASSQDDSYIYRVRTSTYGSTSSHSFSDGEGSQILFDVSQSKIQFKSFSDVTLWTNNSPGSGTSSISKNIYLFANNGTSGVTGIASGVRLYWLKIENTNSNTVNRYFYPAERRSDGAIGMLDVNASPAVFYPNAGSGSFTAGPRLTTTYQITTSVDPSAAGSVTGGGTYNAGTTVTLTANANNGYVFDHWNDNNTDNPRYVIANSNQSYTAYFVASGTPGTTYTITTSVTPSGSGSVSGGGSYNSGSVISLLATANNGYQFSQWSDGNTDNPRSVTVSSDSSYTAVFTQYSPPPQMYTISGSVSPSGTGTVTGSGNYAYGQIATLTATPNPGFIFASWSDGLTVNPRNIEVTSNMSVTAYFMEKAIIDSVLVGTNLNIIQYQGTENWNNVSIEGKITNNTSGTANVDFDLVGYQNGLPNVIYEIDTILNDNYIGYVNITGSYDYTDGSPVSFSRRVYVNGNHFVFNLRQLTASNGIYVQYDFTHLYKNQSVQSLIDGGTNESNDAVDSADSQRDDFNDARDELISTEDNLISDMNDSLDQIDPSVTINDMFTSNFLNAASWVRLQFNRLTNNTPYGSVLGFSLVLGLALTLLKRF